MCSARFLSLLLLCVTVIQTSKGITTTHHDKPEESLPSHMVKVQSDHKVSESVISTGNANATKVESIERQKRLLPYMTFYLEQDFNRPHGHPPPQIQHQPPPAISQLPTSGFATTGAIKQPTILQQYHNKFTELTNGISYQPTPNFVEVNSQKIRLTPFSNSNALPGPFLPMRYPGINSNQGNVLTQPAQPTYTQNNNNNNNNNKQPNYSAIYDQLSQLKLQQQYHVAQSYPRHYPQTQGQIQQLHVHLQPVQMNTQNIQPPPNYIRKQPAQPPQHQAQQLSYIPIRDFIRVQNAYKPTSAKTIVQTYTPSSIEIESQEDKKHDDNDEGNVLADQEQNRYEHNPNVPLKTYNGASEIKNYPIRIHQVHDQFPPNQKDQQYEIKKHVLKPVLVLRQQQSEKQLPYLVLQRKPIQQKQPYNIELQLRPEVNYRPAKQQQSQPQPEHEEVGKIVVESVTPKYIDIIPKYDTKPTLLPFSQQSYEKYKYNHDVIPIRLSRPSGPPRHQFVAVPPVPVPPTPHPHIISYQRPAEYSTTNIAQESPQEEDYVDAETYQKPEQQPQVNLQYENEEEEASSVTTKSPLSYNEKYTSQTPESANYITSTTTTAYPSDTQVFTPIPTKATKIEPQYQEGSNSLSLILKKLQDTNALPHTLTPDNIDNSIRTLVKILSSLKKQHKFQRPIVVQEELSDYDGNNDAGVGLEVPGTVTQIFPENTPEGGTPGTPGVDYPALSTIPQTDFNCKTQRYKGFFGDPETNCQVWHYCDLNGGQASFLCPNGTIFSQVALTCDWWYNVKCSNTAQLYVLNERLYKYILPLAPKFPEDYSGPLVDRYIALKFQEMEEKMKRERKKNKENSSDEDAQDNKTSNEINSQENETIQDDAEELRKEANKQEQSSSKSAPIVVPDESNETTAYVEETQDNSSQHGENENRKREEHGIVTR